jgi:hypothetical protein
MGFETNGDILLRCSYDISCFLSTVRFPYEICCLWAVVPPTWVFQNSRRFGVGGLLFLPIPYDFILFVMHILRVRYPSVPLYDFLMRFHAFGCIIFVWDFLMRVHAFCYRIYLCDFMLLWSLRDLHMGVHALCCLWDFIRFPNVPQGDLLVGFHVF